MKPARKGPSAYPEFRETALRTFTRKSRKKKIFEWLAAFVGGGNVRIMDFGIARTIAGCGLTGPPLFRRTIPMSVALKHRDEPAPDPGSVREGLSAEIRRIVLKSLEKDRERRPRSAGELLSEIDRIDRAEGETRTRAASGTAWRDSIAVLPFADLSAQKDAEGPGVFLRRDGRGDHQRPDQDQGPCRPVR